VKLAHRTDPTCAIAPRRARPRARDRRPAATSAAASASTSMRVAVQGRDAGDRRSDGARRQAAEVQAHRDKVFVKSARSLISGRFDQGTVPAGRSCPGSRFTCSSRARTSPAAPDDSPMGKLLPRRLDRLRETLRADPDRTALLRRSRAISSATASSFVDPRHARRFGNLQRPPGR
jgi:hypothetical protein